MTVIRLSDGALSGRILWYLGRRRFCAGDILSDHSGIVMTSAHMKSRIKEMEEDGCQFLRDQA